MYLWVYRKVFRKQLRMFWDRKVAPVDSALRSVTSLTAHGGWLGFQLPSMIFFFFSQRNEQLDRCEPPPTHKCHPCTFSYPSVMVITVAHRSPSWAGLRNVLLPWKPSQLLLLLGSWALGRRPWIIYSLIAMRPLSEVSCVFST